VGVRVGVSFLIGCVATVLALLASNIMVYAVENPRVTGLAVAIGVVAALVAYIYDPRTSE
jgi:catabolite regulation protein CreA